MALDEAMIRTAARTGATLVRLYTWDVPSLSLGRNQRTDAVYDAERCARQSVPVVRRLTGGRALLHGREVTYSVAAPTSAAPSLRGGYDAINQCLLAALHSLDVPATLAAPSERTPTPGLAPCFEAPSKGELVVEGRKLVGSAQHREAEAFLQHGSLLLDDDQGILNALALVQLPAVPPPATLRALCGKEIDAEKVFDAIEQSIRAAAHGRLVRWSERDLPPDHVAEAASRYRDPRWTWRR
jgi:lipoyl(octanoyl) transferase